jgi:hypothetical protein
MSPDVWRIKTDPNVPAFVVSIPEVPSVPFDFPNADYLRLKPEGIGQSACFRVAKRSAPASGTEMWVSREAFGKKLTGSPRGVEILEVSGWRYQFFRIAHDPTQTFAVFGSCLAITVLVITAVIGATAAPGKYIVAGVGVAGAVCALVGTLLLANK